MGAREKKAETVQAFVDRVRDAKGIYLTDFTQLDVKSITDLRSRFRGVGAEYVVIKNTLARRALEQLDLPDIARFFTGPTAVVIGREDPISAVKVLEEFAQQHNQRPAVKVGVVEKREFSAEDVSRLAKLPPRDQILAELAGALQAPLAQVAYVLQARLIEFAGLLEALRVEREGA
ncbi:MAG TPA: 50S ribosomal protein L10 [Longimicrobiales bacterium]|nr:50S ribosomal protein L10 [Longimicrobiales bacterium]